jgi:hypothetical protein
VPGFVEEHIETFIRSYMLIKLLNAIVGQHPFEKDKFLANEKVNEFRSYFPNLELEEEDFYQAVTKILSEPDNLISNMQYANSVMGRPTESAFEVVGQANISRCLTSDCLKKLPTPSKELAIKLGFGKIEEPNNVMFKGLIENPTATMSFGEASDDIKAISMLAYLDKRDEFRDEETINRLKSPRGELEEIAKGLKMLESPISGLASHIKKAKELLKNPAVTDEELNKTLANITYATKNSISALNSERQASNHDDEDPRTTLNHAIEEAEQVLQDGNAAVAKLRRERDVARDKLAKAKGESGESLEYLKKHCLAGLKSTSFSYSSDTATSFSQGALAFAATGAIALFSGDVNLGKELKEKYDSWKNSADKEPLEIPPKSAAHDGMVNLFDSYYSGGFQARMPLSSHKATDSEIADKESLEKILKKDINISFDDFDKNYKSKQGFLSRYFPDPDRKAQLEEVKSAFAKFEEFKASNSGIDTLVKDGITGASQELIEHLNTLMSNLTKIQKSIKPPKSRGKTVGDTALYKALEEKCNDLEQEISKIEMLQQRHEYSNAPPTPDVTEHKNEHFTSSTYLLAMSFDNPSSAPTSGTSITTSLYSKKHKEGSLADVAIEPEVLGMKVASTHPAPSSSQSAPSSSQSAPSSSQRRPD